MSVSLALGIRLSPSSFQRVKIDNIGLDNKVEQLRIEASKATNLPKQFLELIYCGNILDDNATLRSCGLKQGVMVHVLKKRDKEPPIHIRSMTEADIQELVLAFRTFTRHPSYRSALNRLSRQEVLDNIIMTTPGLNEDPVAISILRDPELLVHMENADTVRRIVELHPSLAEAANHIAAAVHEEAATGSSSTQGTSSSFTYSYDALSDEEEMDSSQSSDSQPRVGDGLSRQQSYSTITAAQLAAALASATGLFPASPRASSSNLSGASGGNTGLITSEMFSQAMQQAIATVVPGTGSETPAEKWLEEAVFAHNMVASKGFYRFPKNKEIFKHWVQSRRADLDDVFKGDGPEYMKKSYVVCSDHFAQEVFRNKNSLSQRLWPGSLPSVLLSVKDINPRRSPKKRKREAESGNQSQKQQRMVKSEWRSAKKRKREEESESETAEDGEVRVNPDGASDMTSDVEAITRRLSRQLQQMRELGLTDNAVNLQALHATGGDVQAAIELVFSGAISSDSH